MKKRFTIIITFIIIAVAVVLALVVNKPFRPTSFVTDGEVFSATVENGGTLLLNLKNDNESMEWAIVQSPENYASDYSTVTESETEFHIIALDGGEGAMEFQCTLGDGTVEQYELTLSISRHQKKHLQIDSVSFVRVSD